MATRLTEYREGGFNPHFRRWRLLLYSEPAVYRSDPPLARADLEVREDPDNPGRLLVTVRGDSARVVHDGRELGRPRALPAAPSAAGRLALSSALRNSAWRRRCPSCKRGGGLGAMPDGGHKCRWCEIVVEELAA